MAEAEEDRILVTAIVEGDADAVMPLYDRYGRLAFGLAYRILNDPSAAEEAVQDAFTRVWRQAASFDGRRGSVRTWLMTIVHHRAIDMLRQRARVQWDELVLDNVGPDLTEPDVWGTVSIRLDQAEIGHAMSTLPEQQREVIELAYFEGMTHVEVAERLGSPLGTVKGRLRLGLRKLHDALDETSFKEMIDNNVSEF